MIRQCCLGIVLVACIASSVQAGTRQLVLSCRPALPKFCGNVHVGCAGRTAIATTRFTAGIDGDVAIVNFAGAPARRGTVSRRDGMVIRFPDNRDWIHIRSDGRYSHRIYGKGRTAMSFGVCTRAE